jgi:hydroxyethylthiazole kinase-like sugar kinase family protein
MQKKESGAKASLLFEFSCTLTDYKLLTGISNGSLAARSLAALGAVSAALCAISLAANSSTVFAALVAAFLLSAFSAAADCSKCNSYDKKHLLHNCNFF